MVKMVKHYLRLASAYKHGELHRVTTAVSQFKSCFSSEDTVYATHEGGGLFVMCRQGRPNEAVWSTEDFRDLHHQHVLPLPLSPSNRVGHERKVLMAPGIFLTSVPLAVRLSWSRMFTFKSRSIGCLFACHRHYRLEKQFINESWE